MTNTKNYTITLDRLEVCDLLMACTSIIIDCRYEMTCDPKCPEFRREMVLPATIQKWKKLHDKLEKQLDQQDAAHNTI